MPRHVKRRPPPSRGSIPHRLQMFSREVRFYREVAPLLDVRVPRCFRAEIASDGTTLLELEDLSSWEAGAAPGAAATLLGEMHRHWEGTVTDTWPWAPRPHASDLVEALFHQTWPTLRGRQDLSADTRVLGDSLLGRVAEAEHRAARAGPPTLTHGDPSFDNMRTSPEGEVALLDWEDFGAGAGVGDLAWLLVSSVDPEDWDGVIDAYGRGARLGAALPAAAVQGLLTMGAEPDGSTEARRWIARLDEIRGRTRGPLLG